MNHLPERPTPEEFRAFILADVAASEDPRLPVTVWDRDGTTASVEWCRPVEGDREAWERFNAAMPFDSVVPYVRDLHAAVPDGVGRFMFSGRMAGNKKGEDFRYWQMLAWLRKVDLHFNRLYMRKGGDGRRDSLIKQEFFEAISPQFRVVVAVDDRPQVCDEVWRANGVPLVQVVDPAIPPLILR